MGRPRIRGVYHVCVLTSPLVVTMVYSGSEADGAKIDVQGVLEHNKKLNLYHDRAH